MRFALVNGERHEAQPGLSGNCRSCGDLMVAKCGKIRIPHWAHRGEIICDPWKEKETEWHRSWKGQFPNDWQEIHHLSEAGEKHIADVKTDQGFVLEFQHSFLNSEERKSRQDFYKKLIWVVHAKKRKRDQAKFIKLLNEGMQPFKNIPLLKLRGFLDECALLRDWAGSPAPIFFDFDETSTLWYLLPHSSVTQAYVVKFSKEYFIELHLKGINHDLEFWFSELINLALNKKLG